MSELKVKKIKKIKVENTIDTTKFDTETFNKMICFNGIDVEPKNLAQFPKSDGEVPKVVKLNCLDSSENETAIIGVDLGKSGDVGTCNGEVVGSSVCKVVKKVKKIEGV